MAKRSKLILFLLLLAGAGLVATLFYFNRILNALVPRWLASTLGDRIRVESVTGSLIRGLTLRGLDVDLGVRGESPEHLRIAEVSLTYDALSSLFSRDRHVRVRARDMDLALDLEKPVFDPFKLRDLKQLLAEQNLTLAISVKPGKLFLLGLPRGAAPFDAQVDVDLKVSGDSPAVYTLALRDRRAAYKVAGRLDLGEIAVRARFDFVSQELLRSPIAYRGYTFKSALDGQGEVWGGLSRTRPPAGPDEMVELAPGRFLAFGFKGEAHGRAGSIQVPGQKPPLLGIQMNATFNPAGLHDFEGQIPLDAGSLAVHGSLPGFDPDRAAATLVIKDVPAGGFPGLLPFPVTGTVTGQVVLTPGAPARFDLDVVAPTGAVFQFDRAVLAGTLAPELLVIESITAHADTGKAQAQGRFDLVRRRYGFQARFERFPHRTFKPLLDRLNIQGGTFTGTLSGEGNLDPITYENWKYRFDVPQAILAREKCDHATLEGRYHLGQSNVDRVEAESSGRFRKMLLSMEDGTPGGYRVKGKVLGLSMAALARGTNATVDGEFLLKKSGGTLVETVTGTISGFPGPGASGAMKPVAFTLTGDPDGGHELSLSHPESFRSTLQLPVVKAATAADLAKLTAGQLEGTYEIKDAPRFLEALGVDSPQVLEGGHVSGRVTVRKGADQGAFFDLVMDEVALETSHGKLRGSDVHVLADSNRLTVLPARMAMGNARLQVAGTLRRSGESTLDVKVDRFPVSLPLTQAGSGRLAGDLSGTAQLSGSLADPRIQSQFTLDRAEISDSGQVLPSGSSQIVGRLDFQDGLLRLGRTKLISGPVSMDVSARVPVDLNLLTGKPAIAPGPMSLSVKLPRSSADFLAKVAPHLITQIDGQVALDLDVSGDTAAPQVRGGLTVQARSLTSPALPGKVTAFDLSLVQEGPSTVVKAFSGRIMGGTFGGAGSWTVAGLSGKSRPGSMQFDLEDVDYKSGGTSVSGLHARLALGGNGPVPGLKGQVGFSKARMNAAGGSDWSGLTTLRQAFARAGLGQVQADVVMDVPNNLWIQSSSFEAEMKGALTLKGPLSQFKLGGELESERGSMTIQGKRLALTQGSVRFLRPTRENLFELTPLDSPSVKSQPDAPYLKFTGETSIDDVRVMVDVKGYPVADGVTTNLRSLPPMEQEEIVTLLATGHRSLETIGRKEVPDLVGYSLATQVESSLVDRQVETLVQRFFELDNFRISTNLVKFGPADSRPTSVSVGKYLAPNVYVAADGNLDTSTSFLNRVELQLKLQKNTALTLERSQGNNINFINPGTFSRPYSDLPENRIGVVQSLKW